MANKDPEILNDTKIVPTVELHLTKSDLVDMVMAEQEEVAETQLDTLEVQFKAAQEALWDAEQKVDKSALAEFKKSNSKLIISAEKFLKGKAVYKIESSKKVETSTPYELTYEVYNNRRRKTTKTTRLPQLNRPYKITAVITTPGFNMYNDQRAENYTSGGKWDIRQHLTEDDCKTLKGYPEMVAAHTNVVKLMGEKVRTETTLINLETMGKRAKARMVRQLLEGSKQGRQLLTTVPKMNVTKLLGVAK